MCRRPLSVFRARTSLSSRRCLYRITCRRRRAHCAVCTSTPRLLRNRKEEVIDHSCRQAHAVAARTRASKQAGCSSYVQHVCAIRQSLFVCLRSRCRSSRPILTGLESLQGWQREPQQRHQQNGEPSLCGTRCPSLLETYRVLTLCELESRAHGDHIRSDLASGTRRELEFRTCLSLPFVRLLARNFPCKQTSDYLAHQHRQQASSNRTSVIQHLSVQLLGLVQGLVQARYLLFSASPSCDAP